MGKLTKAQVLKAVSTAVRPRSVYINNEVHQAHWAHVVAGGIGHPPTAALILRRLRALEIDGLVECVGGPDGIYGFEWSITAAGRLALEAEGT